MSTKNRKGTKEVIMTSVKEKKKGKEGVKCVVETNLYIAKEHTRISRGLP